MNYFSQKMRSVFGKMLHITFAKTNRSLRSVHPLCNPRAIRVCAAARGILEIGANKKFFFKIICHIKTEADWLMSMTHD